MSGDYNSQIEALIHLSARLGRNALLVQAGTGNTSIKQDGVLWIKASGKWLADAERDEMFVPLDLAGVRRTALNGKPCQVTQYTPSGVPLASSIETATHAVVPYAVTLHVHSVNTIAWAVRHDGESQLTRQLSDLPWTWIPYAASGPPLALEVARAFERDLSTQILVLANHGLVICAETCEEAEALLSEVEQRLTIEPRPIPPPNAEHLNSAMDADTWHPATDIVIHSISTDPLSREIVANGSLYPCQPMFLGFGSPAVSTLPRSRPFLSIGQDGVLLRNDISDTELEILRGLAEVARRIDASAPLRYLTTSEITYLMTADAPSYAGAATY